MTGVLCATVALLLGGCSSDNLKLSLVGSLPAGDSLIADDAPTIVYTAIAHNALTCWVGPRGPLRLTHIFHAEAASPTIGGQAEIVLHERDLTSPHPWGQRAFRITLTPLGGGTNTQIVMQNIRLPADIADAIRTDVATWARGEEGCQAQIVRPPPPEPVVPLANPMTAKKKPKG